MGRHAQRDIKRKVNNSPAGTVILIPATDMTLLRYHARGVRLIKSRHDLKTNKRAVLLGEFFVQVRPVAH